MALPCPKYVRLGELPQYDSIYCRLCLTTSLTIKYQMLSWFFDTGRTLNQIIEDFAQIKLLNDDKLSNYVCLDCIEKLDAALEFKALIRDSDLQLKNRFIEIDKKPPDSSGSLGENLFEDEIKVEESKLINDIKVEELTPLDDTSKEINTEDSSSQEMISLPVKKKRIRLIRYNVKCPDCPEILRTYPTIKAHSKIHPSVNRYHCSVCKKGFWFTGEWKRHEFIHKENADFICEMCGKAFRHHEDLKSHKVVHKDGNFKCDQCSKVFRRKIALKHHKLLHSDEFSFECDICHRKFKNRIQLGDHKRQHRPVHKEKCDICGKSFRCLTSHVKYHTKPYKCDICNQSFGTRNILNNHKISHTDDRSFSCDICKKKFKYSASLLTHQRVHDTERRFKCEFCEMGFNYKHLLNGHIQKVHRNKCKETN